MKTLRARLCEPPLTTVATQLGVWPARVGELELGRRRDDEFANRYRASLNAA